MYKSIPDNKFILAQYSDSPNLRSLCALISPADKDLNKYVSECISFPPSNPQGIDCWASILDVQCNYFIRNLGSFFSYAETNLDEGFQTNPLYSYYAENASLGVNVPIPYSELGHLLRAKAIILFNMPTVNNFNNVLSTLYTSYKLSLATLSITLDLSEFPYQDYSQPYLKASLGLVEMFVPCGVKLDVIHPKGAPV